MSQATEARERMFQSMQLTESWPDQSDHVARLHKLAEFYSEEQLATLLGRSLERFKTWSQGVKRGPRTVFDDLGLLNHLDAAVTVTQAVESRFGRDRVSELVFMKRQRLDGRTLADLVAGPEHLMAAKVVERTFGTKDESHD